MSGFKAIIEKLEEFAVKFYSKLLVKGVLLFITLGGVLFLGITGVEYFLWLGTTGRLLLLLLFVGIILFLCYRYILVPVLYLLKVRRGISNKEASVLIGKHFPEIGDRLQNLLELADRRDKSDLLLAAIEKRSIEMKPLPFSEAVNFRESYSYLKYVTVPIAMVLIVWASGSISDFFGSTKRVINYDIAYVAPAPFSFDIMNNELSVLEGESYTLKVNTLGEIRPEEVRLVANGKQLIMREMPDGFEYTFDPPFPSTAFYLTSNGVTSSTYLLEVVKVPALSNFEMYLDFPGYLGLPNRVINGTGNATIPEGTIVTWSLEGINTEAVSFTEGDSIYSFTREQDGFELKKRVFKDVNYQLSTSNSKVKDYDRLSYVLQVVRDEYPVLKVQQMLDSISTEQQVFEGLVSDDHGIASVYLVYYKVGQEEEPQRMLLVDNGANVEEFYYVFPVGLNLVPGSAYELFFEARDNDGIRGGKTVKSQVFSTVVLDDREKEEQRLENQERLVKDLDQGLRELQEQEKSLQKITEQQRQERSMGYEEQKAVSDYLNKQQLQESMMEKFTKQLQENLGEKGERSEMDKLLQERLQRQEEQARKNKELLEKLNEVADKIDREELQKRLEELSKAQSSNIRNLRQLLELTKRYYVTQKASQLAEELSRIAERQEKAAEEAVEEESADKQRELNEQFDALSRQLDELKKDNADLQKPLELPKDNRKQEAIAEDQKNAIEELEKEFQENEAPKDQPKESSKASQKQKSAAGKMRELSEQLRSGSSASGSGESISEDAEMLRQILDNLVVFSFKQEKLFNAIDEEGVDLNSFSRTVRTQKELRQLFEHVDDSLFSLSLRRPELSEFVNEQINEVYYNVDKALQSIAESQMYQAASYQQYAFTASNALAEFLADILDNMQQSMMPGQGQGQGEGFQLPDIIQSQQELQEKMQGSQSGQGQQGSESGESSEQGQGEKGQEGGSGEGKEGDSGSEGSGQGEGKGNGDGQGEGDDGKGADGDGGKENGNGISEEGLQEIYEIYKEQQAIRKRLEEQLQNIIDTDKRDLAKKLALEMERFEEDLLENGITERTQNRMNLIQHQLMKLENAALKQGKRSERESRTEEGEFVNPLLMSPEFFKSKQENIEILNRQALPLRQRYQSIVKEYFKDGY